MAIYQFHCDCGEEKAFERNIKTQGSPSAKCDKCGKAMVRIFSAPGLSFKGSGFYTTDKGGK